jgi:molybdopterin-guanine dinucleotide biosynthesis protein A
MRRVSFPARIDLRYQVMRGIGVREAILIALAAGQAIWLVFVVESLPFVSRLMLAALIAVALIAIATVPIRGYKMEHYLLIVARGMLRPKVYLHQTARSAPIEVSEEPVVAQEEDEQKLPDFKSPREFGEWAAPNVLAVMLLFLALMAMSATMLYFAAGGQLPGLRGVAVGGAW